MDISENIKSQVQNLPGNTRLAITRMARIGFAAKGTVYIVLGYLAFKAALGVSSADVDVRDVFYEISSKPLGKPLLAMIALGLLGYVAWRFTQAVIDTEGKGKGLKGLARRGLYIANGIAYSALTLAALQFLVGPTVKDNQNTPRDLASRVLYTPQGRILVGLVGLIVLGVGLSHFLNVIRSRYHKDLDSAKANGHVVAWTKYLGRFGSLARGLVYSTIGFLLLQAAFYRNPFRAGGVGEAMRTIAISEYGPILLAGVAVGLVAYGGFSLLAALYNRIQIPED